MAQHDQSPPQATYTFTVQATIEGVTAPLAIQAASINELRKAVRLLEANQLLAPQPVAPIVWNTTPEGLPICPKHGAPMKRREKQGDSWHSHNVGTEDRPLYCRGYAGKDSPGYEV
jgi:hypothetical protein